MAKFTVVTACRNAERYIEETVRSVLAQTVFSSGRAELEYLVYDGASTDRTLAPMRPFESQGVRVTSEPDSGLYAALAKGLQMATGDYVANLNAGDLLHPAGLGIAAKCFELPGVDWLSGYASVLNEHSGITQCWLPYRCRRRLFACGAYGTTLPFLQQESTVWRRTLHAIAGKMAIRSSGCRFLILRTSRVYAERGQNFLLAILRKVRTARQLRVVADQVGAPTSAGLVAWATAAARVLRARQHEIHPGVRLQPACLERGTGRDPAASAAAAIAHFPALSGMRKWFQESRQSDRKCGLRPVGLRNYPHGWRGRCKEIEKESWGGENR